MNSEAKETKEAKEAPCDGELTPEEMGKVTGGLETREKLKIVSDITSLEAAGIGKGRIPPVEAEIKRKALANAEVDAMMLVLSANGK